MLSNCSATVDVGGFVMVSPASVMANISILLNLGITSSVILYCDRDFFKILAIHFKLHSATVDHLMIIMWLYVNSN